jgi:hypothetical protein
MGYHIKRDGAYLCKEKITNKRYWSNKYNFIPFSSAHANPLKGCCKGCKKRYFEILSKLENPIIV